MSLDFLPRRFCRVTMVCPVCLEQHYNDPEITGFVHIYRTVCLSTDVSVDIGDRMTFNNKCGSIIRNGKNQNRAVVRYGTLGKLIEIINICVKDDIVFYKIFQYR